LPVEGFLVDLPSIFTIYATFTYRSKMFCSVKRWSCQVYSCQALRQYFPKLRVGNASVTSCPDARYNCIAWAAKNNAIWWQYDPQGTAGVKTYWPRELTEGDTVPSWTHVFELEGYKQTDNGRYERGFEKIAIYADKNGKPTHVARQIGSGRWTSKLGKGADIEHDNLDRLAGGSKDEYGSLVKFLVRRKR
jgi:hypothetical protein